MLRIAAGIALCGLCLAQAPRKVVATASGQPIYEDELLAAARGQLAYLERQQYEAKRRALETLIDERLIIAEAARRGTTPEALLDREVYAKIATPADAEIEAFYLAQQDRLQQPLEELKPRLQAALIEARRGRARAEFAERLREAAAVRILLDPPRTLVEGDPTRLRGRRDAPVRIVEFSDFDCPYCRRVQESLASVLKRYGDRVSISYRDFPLAQLHPNAMRAAAASRCALEQGKFWEYHDRLFANQGQLDPQGLKRLAAEAGMDAAAFDACLASGRTEAAIHSDIAAAQAAGVSGTPAFFINGVAISGALPASEFEKIIDEELARLGQAGAPR